MSCDHTNFIIHFDLEATLFGWLSSGWVRVGLLRSSAYRVCYTAESQPTCTIVSLACSEYETYRQGPGGG